MERVATHKYLAVNLHNDLTLSSHSATKVREVQQRLYGPKALKVIPTEEP